MLGHFRPWLRRGVRRRVTALIVAAAVITPQLIPTDAAGSPPPSATVNLQTSACNPSTTPTLGLTLGVNKSSVIPADVLTYTATVSNNGTTLGFDGIILAKADGNSDATVASYFVEIAYQSQGQGNVWIPMAVQTATTPGYVPIVPAPTAPPMKFAATPQAVAAVTYPQTGDRLLGTFITNKATAQWSYHGSLSVTQALATILADPSQSDDELQVTVHVEATPVAGNNQGHSTDMQSLLNTFQPTDGPQPCPMPPIPGGPPAQCTGTLAVGTYGDVMVPNGATCTLGVGVQIGHDLTVGQGATLVDAGATVENDISAHQPAGIAIVAASPGQAGVVGHDVHIDGATGAAPGTGKPGSNQLCDTKVGHDVSITNTAAGAGSWMIGDPSACTGRLLSVGHDMNVTGNAAPVSIKNTPVGHDLNASNNAPGGATVNNNTIAHDCNQSNNSPYAGAANVAGHANACGGTVSTQPGANSTAALNVIVVFTPPTGPSQTFNSTTNPALASLAAGASTSLTPTYTLPTPPARAPADTNASYLAKLRLLEGAILTGAAGASGNAADGSAITAPVVSAATTEHLPIVTVTKTGPATSIPGIIAMYPLALANTGGAGASGLVVTDSLPGGASGTVTGAPSSLSPGATASAMATYLIPTGQSPGGLSDTASATWNDANNGSYGPVSSVFTTTVVGPPTVTITTPPQGAVYNLGQAVDAAYTCAESVGGPGIASCSGSVASGAAIDTSAPGSHTFAVTATSKDGLTATVSSKYTVVGPPTVTIATPPQGAVYNQSQTVDAGYSCAEATGGPGISSCSGPVPTGSPIDTSTTGKHTFSVTATSSDGQSASVSTSYTVLGPPTALITTPPNGAQYGQGQVIDASYSCADAPSAPGITSCSGPVANGAPIDTSTTGAHTFTVTATSQDGQKATATASYTVKPSTIPLAATTPVSGLFFAEAAGSSTFVAKPGDTPAFSEMFADIAFNPPPGQLAGPVGEPTPQSVPFTDVLTDAGGGYAGVQPAQGNGYKAGATTQTGDLTTFDAVFSGTLRADQGGYLNLSIVAGDGFLFGVGGGATAVSGIMDNAPSSGVSSFNAYSLMAAENRCLKLWDGSNTQNGALGPGDYQVTIKLPAAGSYPYELDYFSCNSLRMWANYTPIRSLVLRAESLSSTPPNAPTVYVAYADSGRATPDLFQFFPYPWQQAPGVNFQGSGCVPNCSYDGGAIRVDNTTTAPMTINRLTVTLAAPASGYYDSGSPPCVYDIWAPDAPSGTSEFGESAIVLQPGQTVVYTSENPTVTAGCANTNGTFDTSDVPITGCQQSGIIPQIALTANGQTSTYTDKGQLLNTGGVDKANCFPRPTNNESTPWTRIGGPGAGADIPLPPVAALTLEPTQSNIGGPLTNTVSDLQTFAADATGANGANLSGVPVTFIVTGANPQRVNATTDANGAAALTYRGATAGTDQVVVIGNYQGLELGSGQAALTWQIPIPGGPPSGGTPGQAPPQVTITTPTDATTLTAPAAVQAAITPPAGESVSAWQVTLTPQGGSPTTIGSGSGAPPATLATIDPVQLASGSYQVQVSASASGGGSNTATVNVEVGRVARIGRFSQTYQDASLPLAGIPFSIQRTYSSWDKTTGDFGVGWHLSLSQVSVATNGPLGAGGWTAYPGQCSLLGCSYAYKSSLPHEATVTLPGGTQEIFDYTPSGTFGPLFFLDGTAAFAARPGTNTTGTLTLFNGPGVDYGFDGNLYTTDSGDSTLYDATDFLYTDAHGTQYLISTLYGLRGERLADGACIAFGSTLIDGNTGTGTTQGEDSNHNGTCSGGGSFAGRIMITRDSQTRVTQIQLLNGSTFGYSYNSVGDLTAVTLPGTAGTDTYTYDSQHNLLTQSGPGAPIFTRHYDTNGNLTSVTDGNGNTVPIANNPSARTETLTDPLNREVIVVSFDASGNVTSKQETSGGVSRTTTQTFDPFGDVTSSSDPLGNMTSTTYDASRNPTSATDALGHISTAAYDPLGDVTSRVDELGRNTAAAYNASGYLLSVTDPTDATSHFEYNNAAQSAAPTTITDAWGNAYALQYDPGALLNRATDPLGRTASFSHDAAGNLTVSEDGLGDTTVYTYDADNRVVKVSDPNGAATHTSYDALGNVTSVTNGNGNSTSYTYDSANQLTKITDANGGLVTFVYDADGNLTSFADPDGHVTSYGYDGFGDRTSSTDPAGNKTMYTYDGDGRVTSSTDAKVQTFSYGYDADGRLVRRVAPDEATSWTYDAAGELTQMIDSTGSTSYTYDAAGRIIGVASPEGTIDYTYNANGQRATMTFTGRGTIRYGYDSGGNLTDETGLGQSVGFSYDSANRLTAIALSNSVTTAYGYDRASNISSVVSTSGANTLQALTYVRDADGNPLSTTMQTGTTNYLYDNLDRLRSAVGPSGLSFAYTYDAAGNITSATQGGTAIPYAHDSAGRLTAFGAEPVTTDADGNITTVGSQIFNWNSLGRLTSVTSGGATTRYSYDGDGLRIAETDGGSSSRTLWDRIAPSNGGLEMGVEHPVAGASVLRPGASNPTSAGTQSRYALPTRAVSASTPAFPVPASIGNLAFLSAQNRSIGQVDTTNTVGWYLADAQGSVVGLTNSTGAQSGSGTYAPYGQAFSLSGAQPPTGFTGQLQGADGLVYLRSRYLDPSLGSFLSLDSQQPNAGGTPGYNAIAYGGDAPASLIDPTGHAAAGNVCQKVILGLALSLATAVGGADAPAVGALSELFKAMSTMACVLTEAYGKGGKPPVQISGLPYVGESPPPPSNLLQIVNGSEVLAEGEVASMYEVTAESVIAG